MFVASIAVSVLLVVVFVFSGVRKIPGAATAATEAEHLHLPLAGYRLIGVAEVLGAAGLLVGIACAPLGVLAAGALVVLMIGAVGTHLRVHDPIGRWAPAAAIVLLAIAALVLRLLSA